MVLAGRADHRRTADIDVLDRVVDRRILARDGLFEWIQVDDEQVDRLDAVFGHDRLVGTAPTEQAAVDNGVQRLHAAIHDFGESRLLGDLDDIETGFAKLMAGAAGRQHLDTQRGEALHKRNESTLVRDTDQRASYVEHADSWGRVTG